MRFMLRRRLKKKHYIKEWQELQSLLASRKNWPEAIAKADKLLARALKQRGFRGKTTGERLVAAQRVFNFNEDVWYSHKFSNKLMDTKIDVRTLKKNDIAKVLIGFRQALRDLGGLEKNRD